MRYCNKCGVLLTPDTIYCSNCGSRTRPSSIKPLSARSKLIAGLLGILLGAWGVHNFYLGKTGRGLLQILLTALTFGLGGLWGCVEGILILCNRITTDADGKPLLP